MQKRKEGAICAGRPIHEMRTSQIICTGELDSHAE